MRTLIAAASATALFAGAAAQAETASKLEIYAAFAKVNENIAEAVGAVLLATNPTATAEIRSEAVSDWRGDLTQLDGYFSALEGMPLTGEQRAALATVRTEWARAADQAEEVLANPSAHDAEALSAWWESLDEIDDAVDDVLEAMLEEEGVGA